MDLEETTKDECKALLYTGMVFINLLNSCSYCDEITIVRKSSIRKLPKAERQIKHRKSRSVISTLFRVLICCCVVFANLPIVCDY